MPITRSKAERRAANRTAIHTNAQLRGVQRKVVQTGLLAEQMYNERAFLARVLAFTIAANGGELKIPKDALKVLPAEATLQQMYDHDSETFRFIAAMPVADESPIDIVQPVIVPA